MTRIRVTIIGAAGRMGRRLTALVGESQDMALAGAIDVAASPVLGTDAGILAGVAPAGVKISADLDAALRVSDAVINFSTAGVVEATEKAVAAGCAVVIGTTALETAAKARLAELAKTGRIVWAPNMSVGVNLLFHLVGEVAAKLADYDIEIVEMHHNLKKDAPSGTAVRLGEVAAAARRLEYEKAVRHGRAGMVGARTKEEIGMHAVRGGDVVGEHTVIFATGGERLELTHKASSRDTFACGALRAVRFLSAAPAGKLYDMQDVLGLR